MLRIAILTLAIVAGGAAAWLSAGVPRAATTDLNASQPVPLVSLQEVLVAAADIAPGMSIGPASVRWQPWPQEGLSENYIVRSSQPDALDRLSGMIANREIMSGEPVHGGKLVSGEGSVLSILLPAGSRAIAVRISAENTAGGFILPNDRVDVLHTTTRQGADGRSVASSRTLLRNIRVLAIDQMTDNADGSIVGKTATLELKAEEVEIIAAAEASGAISLSLRSLADSHEPTGEDLAAAAATKSVRVLRAGQEEIVELK